MERLINIDGIGVPFKASGATPRIYRGVTGRDLFTDLAKLENVKTFTPELLEVYEDLAYTMRKQGNDALGEEKEKDFPPHRTSGLIRSESLIYTISFHSLSNCGGTMKKQP